MPAMKKIAAMKKATAMKAAPKPVVTSMKKATPVKAAKSVMKSVMKSAKKSEKKTQMKSMKKAAIEKAPTKTEEEIERKEAPKKTEEEIKQERIAVIREQIIARNVYGGEKITSLVLTLIDPAFNGTAEERHEFQARCVAMIEELLAINANTLKENTASFQAIVEAGPAQQQQFDNEINAFAEQITAKQEQIAGVETGLEEAKNKLSEATEQKKAAEAALEALKQVRKENEKIHNDVESAVANCFQTLVAEACNIKTKEGKKMLKQLDTLVKQVNCDESLISAAPAALSKTADARGPFDAQVIQHLELQFQKFMDTLNNEMSQQDGKEQTATDFINSCVAQETACAEHKKTVETSLEQNKMELADSEAAMQQKEAEKVENEAALFVAEENRNDCAEQENIFATAVASFEALKTGAKGAVEEEPTEADEDVEMADVEGVEVAEIDEADLIEEEQEEEYNADSENQPLEIEC